MNAHWTLPCAASSVGDARGALCSLLRGAGSSLDESDAAAMVISELMTNAVVHSDDRRDEQIEVVVEFSEREIHIEVLDHNPRAPVQRDVGLDAPSGRGLTIVDALSTAWGWEPIQGVGKRVWCDVPRTACPVDGHARSLGPRPQGPTPMLRSGI